MDFNKLKIQIDESLKKYFDLSFHNKYNKRIYEAMAYSINIGGKRVRPMLMLLTYDIFKDDHEGIMPMAMAIEMIHTYSLIHDDLPCMDDDTLRRGKPTNHMIFGEAIAVLAGDGLLNEAMNILFKYSLDNGEKALRASMEISEAAGAEGMIGGQVVDIINENNENGISLEELNYMHLKKTGELIKASVLSGAILAEASKNDIIILEEYGYKLGLAFQIKDDILDVIGSPEKLGKNINCDTNKTNYISIFGLDKCKNKCEELTKECLQMLGKVEGNIEGLKELTNLLLERKY